MFSVAQDQMAWSHNRIQDTIPEFVWKWVQPQVSARVVSVLAEGQTKYFSEYQSQAPYLNHITLQSYSFFVF